MPDLTPSGGTHPSHHRGQAGSLLMQSGVDMGVTNLHECMPDSPP
jgi:uncharacterized damage-inducible protein DinB